MPSGVLAGLRVLAFDSLFRLLALTLKGTTEQPAEGPPRPVVSKQAARGWLWLVV